MSGGPERKRRRRRAAAAGGASEARKVELQAPLAPDPVRAAGYEAVVGRLAELSEPDRAHMAEVEASIAELAELAGLSTLDPAALDAEYRVFLARNPILDVRLDDLPAGRPPEGPPPA